MKKRLVILEGPDGGGKTTLGHELSARLKVPVDNHGPYKGEHQIWKHYFDSMLPAYSGQRDVILDRCWLAEPIYGEVYRNGVNRLESWQVRILEYVASECRPLVVWCLPPLERCLATFRGRREAEMLESEEQLRMVYDAYKMYSSLKLDQGLLPQIMYDYTAPFARRWIEELA